MKIGKCIISINNFKMTAAMSPWTFGVKRAWIRTHGLETFMGTLVDHN